MMIVNVMKEKIIGIQKDSRVFLNMNRSNQYQPAYKMEKILNNNMLDDFFLITQIMHAIPMIVQAIDMIRWYNGPGNALYWTIVSQ
jgi:hypothetical protein